MTTDEALAAERELGRRFAHYRVALGLTVETVARQIGLSVTELNRIEKGNGPTSYTTTVRVCEALDIDLSDLLAAELPRVCRTHDVDLPSDVWHLVDAGVQTFDVRHDTPPFLAGDHLRVHERLDGADTGRVLDATITCLAHAEQYGIAPGWVVLGIQQCNDA